MLLYKSPMHAHPSAMDLPSEVMLCICSNIKDYRVILRLGAVSKSLLEATCDSRAQIVNSQKMVDWIDSLEYTARTYGNGRSFLPKHVEWAPSPHTRFAEITEHANRWKCSLLVDPMHGIEIIARNHRLDSNPYRDYHQVYVRKWIRTLEELRKEVLPSFSEWLRDGGLSLQFQNSLIAESTEEAVSADTRIFRNDVIEPVVLAWLTERRVSVNDAHGRFMTYPNDDGTSWAFVRKFEGRGRVNGVLYFSKDGGAPVMDLLYYYNKRTVFHMQHHRMEFNAAITGRRKGMAQTTANLDWLQNMDKRAWNRSEWAVEIHSKN